MDEASAWRVLAEANASGHNDHEGTYVFVGTEKEVAAFERMCRALGCLDTDMISEEELVSALEEKNECSQ